MAEAVLGVPAEALARIADLGLAESALAAPHAGFGGEELYPELHVKAAVLASRIVRNHPLPDGNKRVALVLMLDFLARHGRTLASPAGGQEELARTVEAVAARELSEPDFAAWVGRHLADRPSPGGT